MKLFVITRWQDSPLDVRMYNDAGNRLYSGHNHMGQVGQWAAAMFSGTAAQLTAINALPNVVGLVVVREGGAVRWAELDGVISAAVRTKLQTWINARGLDYTVPAGATYRAVITAAYRRLNALFEIEAFDVAGG